MTSHELARQLLEGPDWPIFTPGVREYDDSGEMFEPIVTEEREEIEDLDEPHFQSFLMINYANQEDD